MDNKGYKEWLHAEQRQRTIACCVCHAFCVCIAVNAFQLSLSYDVKGAVLSLFSLEWCAYVGMFALSQTVLLIARAGTLSVTARCEPVVPRVIFYMTSPRHVGELVLFPASAYSGAWSFLQLAKHLQPGDVHAASRDEACLCAAAVMFSIEAGAFLISKQEGLLRFPSMQLPRMRRFQVVTSTFV
jgi:hypothetical protein